MNEWIDLHALWRIVAYGLAFGAVLPVIFGVGLRLLDGPGDDEAVAARNPLALAAAAVCFGAVLAAIGWGVYLIVDGT